MRFITLPVLLNLTLSYGRKLNNLYSTNQKKYQNYLTNPLMPVVVAIGPAGTGKTLLACQNAIKEYKENKIEKIIITRPVVSVGEELGFLPGTINEKMDPWTRPIFDIFREYYSEKNLKDMIRDNILEISPLAFMRGRTFTNSYIIADEMQNSSPKQMIMLTTRLGIDSKLVITGDLQQCDLNIGENGLQDFMKRLKYYDNSYIEEEEPFIGIVELNNEDVKRSPIVSKILNIYK